MSDSPASPGSRDGRIKGGFPGGPSRPGDGDGEPTRRVPTVEEIEAGLSRRRLSASRRRRRARMLWGVLAAMGLAGAVGLGLGMLTRPTQENLTAAAENRNQQDNFISKEVNRTLLQLWKMEDIEAARNQGRTR